MGEYIFGYTDKELLRLELQAELFEKESKRTLELAGIKKGMKCIDIGCGIGYTSIILAELVGSDGDVTAIDISPEPLAIAKRNAERRGIKNIEFVLNDINDPTYLEDNTYDLVYSRFLFTHLEDPVRALNNMVRITKPHGVVVAEDFNHEIRITYPYNKYLESLRLMLITLLKANGSRSEVSGMLYNYFMKAGLNTNVELYSIALPMNNKYKIVPFLFAAVLKDRFIKAKLIDEDKYAEIENGIKEFVNEENALLLYSSVYRVWGYKNAI